MRDNTPRPSDASVPTGAAAVGQMLREARESLGLDLAQVAEDTRIRLTYLEAIEDGRFADLPGSAYAPAFLRGYAASVGLDVDRVLQVYRSGDAPAVTAPAYHFPVVAAERRTPRGAMMLASVALLIGAYVTWHALTRDQMTQDARVPPVPQRLLADQKPAVDPAASPPTPQPPTAQPAAAPGTAAGATPTGVPGPTTPAPAATPSGPTASPPPVVTQAPPLPGIAVPPTTATAAPAPPGRGDGRPPADGARGPGGDVKPEPAPPVAAAPAPRTPVARTGPEPVPGRRTAPGSGAGDGVTAQDTDPTQSNRVTSRTPPRPAPVPPPSTAGSDAPPPAPQQAAVPPELPRPAVKARPQSGPPSPQARTVRAEVDSTLELRGPGGEVLATTYLRAGTSYTVPEHVGYALIPTSR